MLAITLSISVIINAYSNLSNQVEPNRTEVYSIYEFQHEIKSFLNACSWTSCAGVDQYISAFDNNQYIYNYMYLFGNGLKTVKR